ncbi:MAG TPA: SNF2-related protein [Candidatus Acidoferrales bacterium]|nr:SNF2-related protein [Candidatus Acidoferrales bacterium]
MNLTRTLSQEFDASVRQRGLAYFARHLVRIRHGSESEVDARVAGSRDYDVSLRFEHGVLNMSCDCAYFDSSGPCKHLWATILAAETKGHLAPVVEARNFRVEYGADLTEFELDYADTYIPRRRPERPAPPPKPQPPAPPAVPVWRRRLDEVAREPAFEAVKSAPFPEKRQILYLVNVPSSVAAGSLVLSMVTRDRKLNGEWSRMTPLSLKRGQLADLPVAEDRELVATLVGGRQYYGWASNDLEQVPSECQVAEPLASRFIHAAVKTGRCFLKSSYDSDGLSPLSWDEGEPWRYALEMRRDPDGGWTVTGVFRRGEQRMDVAEPVLLTRGCLMFTRDRAALLAGDTPYEWVRHFRKSGTIQAPLREGEALLAALLQSPRLPPIEVAEELRFQEITAAPRPGLRIGGDRSPGASKLRAHLSFDYEGHAVASTDASSGLYDSETRRFLRRDAVAEQAAKDLLASLNVKFQPGNYYQRDPCWEIAPTKLPRVVHALVEAGWHLEAEGKIFRRPGSFRMEVSSGVDWFELHGEVSYGETAAQLPELLAALRRGDNMVRLDDGTYGMLPEEWLARIGALAGMGTAHEGHVRFRRSQAGLLDALLATQPEARCDETFARLRDEMRAFDGIAAAEQPEGFVGRLRDYQREGLGWMHFLRRFGFGGCLADDMGVGKTAQVLALLETRREPRAEGKIAKPSLVVVPKSLVFNWKQEAERFTPRLRLLDYTGLARELGELGGYDVVLTTYGTLRRDALRLKDVDFDYVILDEAQAVKNAATESSKAVRLLRGDHRLALSGTPVENHLGELWTLFEFLNPGMLGAASVFKLTGGSLRVLGEEARRLLAHALRPFILRRTKEQVARELPQKTEQTIYCEMEPAQRKLYDELRSHYRSSLLGRIAAQGLAKSKIQVLEALLRLRQAACHPGLLDPQRVEEPSAKLDVLLAQLREVLEEGHKALVFSQFTSLLSIVRARLDAERVNYEYLDGATHDRQSCVERFQTDEACRVFLVSLKAGGLGLNLTAAEYVFLLDPWWNPAVEAQAVDRAHRIGQTRNVFAYRLIARDTVEEKVLELQTNKRDLAAAIINQDNSLIRSLRREDLELLLA